MTTKDSPAPRATTPATAPDKDIQWYDDKAELARVEAMLVRAGLLVEAERAYMRSKPWKWSGERKVCDVLEKAMQRAHVRPERGWQMTLVELAQAMVEADR